MLLFSHSSVYILGRDRSGRQASVAVSGLAAVPCIVGIVFGGVEEEMKDTPGNSRAVWKDAVCTGQSRRWPEEKRAE